MQSKLTLFISLKHSWFSASVTYVWALGFSWAAASEQVQNHAAQAYVKLAETQLVSGDMDEAILGYWCTGPSGIDSALCLSPALLKPSLAAAQPAVYKTHAFLQANAQVIYDAPRMHMAPLQCQAAPQLKLPSTLHLHNFSTVWSSVQGTQGHQDPTFTKHLCFGSQSSVVLCGCTSCSYCLVCTCRCHSAFTVKHSQLDAYCHCSIVDYIFEFHCEVTTPEANIMLQLVASY